MVTDSQQLYSRGTPSKVKEIQQIGLLIRDAVLSSKTEMSWPPRPSELCSQSPTRTRCFSLHSSNWRHRNHNGISSSCFATCQLFWAGHHIPGNWTKTRIPKINTSTLRRQKLWQLMLYLFRCYESLSEKTGQGQVGRPISSKLILFHRHQIEIRVVKYELLVYELTTPLSFDPKKAYVMYELKAHFESS